jgi:hypothetical protein
MDYILVCDPETDAHVRGVGRREGACGRAL